MKIKYKPVIYLKDPSHDPEYTSVIDKVNSDWDPIFWLIMALVGTESISVSDLVPGVIKKWQRIEAVEEYLKNKDGYDKNTTKEKRAEKILDDVVKKCFGVIPKYVWIDRAYGIEEFSNDWEIRGNDKNYMEYVE